MKQFKVAFFHSNGFQDLRAPSFAGPDFILAIALGPSLRKLTEIPTQKLQFEKLILEGEITFSFGTLTADKKNCSEAVNTLFEDLFSALSEKLSENCFISTHFSWQDSINHLVINKKKTLPIPKDSQPIELQIASSFARSFFEKKWSDLRWEYPQINFQKMTKEQASSFVLQKKYLPHFDLRSIELNHAYLESQRKKKLLLHVCCGPDAAGVIEQLKKDYELLCFWYDPNIQPKSEYDKRLNAFEKVAQIENVPYIVGEYDFENFLEKISGLEQSPEQGAKCTKCYDMRLERSAVEAKKQNCDLFTTTLAISPHKVQEKLKNFGNLYGSKHSVPYMAKNFMKMDGFKDSVNFTKKHDIFRQDYCGCWFSLYEGGAEAKSKAKKWNLTKSKIDSGDYQLPNTMTE